MDEKHKDESQKDSTQYEPLNDDTCEDTLENDGNKETVYILEDENENFEEKVIIETEKNEIIQTISVKNKDNYKKQSSTSNIFKKFNTKNYFSETVSWELIKNLTYVLIFTILLDIIDDSLLALIVLLILLKIDVLGMIISLFEFLAHKLKSLFNK